MTELTSGSKDKKEYFRWQYAHKIVKIAKEKRKAIVIEELKIKKAEEETFQGENQEG